MENWYQNYDELTDYIKEHPSIEISPNMMVLPDDVRPGFYRLFDRVRAAFVKEKFPTLLAEASQLSASFAAAKAETMACLNLKEVDVSPPLAAFLQDTVDGLMRPLFEPLFALLQGKTNIEAFEQTAPNLVEASAKTLMRQGYLHWTALSLIKLMVPDAAYTVQEVDERDDVTLNVAYTLPGREIHEVPRLHVAERLTLDISEWTQFMVPRGIIHSGAMNTFAAISTAFHEVFRRAKILSEHLEWHNLEELRLKVGIGRLWDLWPDMTLVLGDSAEDLRITADYFYLVRPDIIVEVMDTEDWYQAGGMEKVKRHKDLLKPRMGVFVVCRQPVPQAAIDELEPPPPPPVQAAIPAAEGAEQPLPQAAIDELEPPPPPPVQAAIPAAEGTGQPLPIVNAAPVVSASEPCHDIHLLSVGYDTSALEPIVEAMRKSRAGDN